MLEDSGPRRQMRKISEITHWKHGMDRRGWSIGVSIPAANQISLVIPCVVLMMVFSSHGISPSLRSSTSIEKPSVEHCRLSIPMQVSRNRRLIAFEEEIIVGIICPSPIATFDGLDAYVFNLADNAFESDMDDPGSNCYCLNKQCLKKGLGDITPCYYSKFKE